MSAPVVAEAPAPPPAGAVPARRRGPRTGRAVLRVATLALAVTVAFLVLLVVVVPRATGAVPLTVLSGSMAPAVPAGSVVVVRPVDPATLVAGDVVTFQRERGSAAFVTHRVAQVHTDPVLHFTTRGDANDGTDPEPVHADNVRGEVWYHVPLVGHLSAAAGLGGAGRDLVVVALLGYAAAQVGRAAWARRRASTPALGAAVTTTVALAVLAAGTVALGPAQGTAAAMADVAVMAGNVSGAVADGPDLGSGGSVDDAGQAGAEAVPAAPVGSVDPAAPEELVVPVAPDEPTEPADPVDLAGSSLSVPD